MLFNEKGNTLERFVNEVSGEDRNAVSRFIHDLISWLKARLKGEKVSLKIVKLENRFAAVLRNVDNTNLEQNNDGNSYSFGDIDKDKSKKYNKAIKVPNVAYRIISSRRTERYANLNDTDIPLTDIITIGEQRLNTATQYFIRNNSRSDFVIYKKRKSSPKKGTLEYDINDEIDRAIARHSGLERDNQQNGAQNNSLVPSKRRGTEIRNKQREENQQPNDRRHNNDTSRASRRRRQLEIIQNTNPAYVDHLTWIRSVEDIHTLQETLEMSDWAPYDEFDPDYSKQDALNAIKNGKIKVYSSHPIGQGVFVTPSKMEAQTYAGDGTVYEQVVNIDDIAWIDPTQGQYAKVEAGLDNSAFSMPENDIRYSFEDDVASLTEQRQNGEISESEYLNELQRLMNEANEKYGAIPKGENPKVDVTVPKQVGDKRNTRRFVRTVLESGALT